jgi:CcmD family protein
MADIGGGIGWVVVVNLVIWTGLFLYVLRLHRRVRAAERAARQTAGSPGEEP